MRDGWPEHLPIAFYTGLSQFNQEQYYACHATLEALWIPERHSVRELYQGVLQIAVGCYHLTVRANFIGATRKLDEGARRLERAGVVDELYGVQWSALIAEANKLQGHLHTLGIDSLSDYDQTLLPRVTYRVPSA